MRNSLYTTARAASGTIDAESSQPKAPGILMVVRLELKWSSQPRSWLEGNFASSTPK